MGDTVPDIVSIVSTANRATSSAKTVTSDQASILKYDVKIA